MSAQPLADNDDYSGGAGEVRVPAVIGVLGAGTMGAGIAQLAARAGARTLLQNTGAVLSIAFVLAIITSAVPKATLFAVFSGLAQGLSAEKLAPFIANMHVALWVLAGTSLIGTAVCLMRPRHESASEQAQRGVTPWEEAIVEEAMLPGLDGAPSPRRRADELSVRS